MSMRSKQPGPMPKPDLASLTLTGMRVGPLDENKNPLVGLLQEPIKHNPNQQTVFVKKSLSGFGAGFKIPEEYRQKQLRRKGEKKVKEADESDQEKDQNQVTRDEIFQLLNLGNAEGGIGAGKYGNSSKQALTNDLIEGLEKDLEKLKRFEENLKIRKLMTVKGGQAFLNETDQDRENARINALHRDVQAEGAHIIHADEKVLQLLRHKPGTLDSLKDLDFEKIEAARQDNAQVLEELANAYFSTKQNKSAGKMIRKMMGYDKKDKKKDEDKKRYVDDEDYTFGADRVSSNGDEDDEAQVIGKRGNLKSSMRSRSKRDLDSRSKKDLNSLSGNKKRVRVRDDQDGDTPPTRSRSKRRRARFNGDDSPEDFDFKSDEEDAGYFGANRKKSKDGQKKSVTVNDIKKKHGLSASELDRLDRKQSRGSGLTAERLNLMDNKSGSRSKSGARVNLGREISYNQASPHREIYEAKFEKFMTNKQQKDTLTRRMKAFEKPDFDITTKNTSSPSKKASKYTTVVGAELSFKPSGKYEQNYLMPDDYEDHLLREETLKMRNKDPFKFLGVSEDDKMAFFLLKWVFNAIKIESVLDDKELKGQAYVTKKELVKNLVQNDEVMANLQVTDKRKFKNEVRDAPSAKQGCLTWKEFLDFFFLRDATLQDRIDGNDWWDKLDINGNLKKEDDKKAKETKGFLDDEDGNELNEQALRKRQQKLLLEVQEVAMTPALEQLIATRKKKVIDDVETDFANMRDSKAGLSTMASSAMMNKKTGKSGAFSTGTGLINQDGVAAQLGFKRDKSKCLLLPSQIEMMKSEFDFIDRDREQMVNRGALLMHLRTTPSIVNFIGDDAVQVAGSRKKVLTVDQILHEVELDENYEITQQSKQQYQTNLKQYITWSDFLSYFEDFREIEDRHANLKALQKTRDKIKENKEGDKDEIHPEEEEFKTLLETEKERRLKELPKLRPADMIDISEEQLVLLREVYNGCNKVNGVVSTQSFFIGLRHNTQVERIRTTIARDPEGQSRLPRETFQQVFDRMEREIQTKTLDWETIIEYFTKRGRPLSKEEIKKLQDEDERIKQEQEEIKRKEEEIERRRLARMMQDIAEDDEDVDDHFNQEKQMEEQRRRRRQRRHSNSDGSAYGSEDDSYDQEYGSDINSSDYDSDLERDHGRHHRAPRAKSRDQGFNEGDLRDKTITLDDYMGKVRSNSQRKGRFGVTVPKPFRFDMRDQTKEKNIRQRKVEEMVQEKTIEEQNLIKHQFRSKPIPAAVLVPRYQAIQDANEQRRMRVKQESIVITKQREAPFSFWEREKVNMAKKQRALEDPPMNTELIRPRFKANEIPASCATEFYHIDLQHKEREREARIRKAAEDSLEAAKMPSRMQQALEQSKSKQLSMQSQMDSQYSFKPQINKGKTKAQFEMMQKRSADKLAKSKNEYRPTVPQSPFSNPHRTQPLNRDYVNEGQPGKQGRMAPEVFGDDKLKATLAAKEMGNTAKPPTGANASTMNASRSRMSSTKGPKKQPSSTKATQLLQQRRREEMEQKRKQEEQLEKEQADRKVKQNRIKAQVQARLKGDIKNAQEEIDRKAKEARIDARKKELESKKELEQRVAAARERGGLLIDNYNKKRTSNLALVKATSDVVQTLRDSGFTESQAKSKLNEEEKEAYEFKKFQDLHDKRIKNKQINAKEISKPKAAPKIVSDDDDDYADDSDHKPEPKSKIGRY